MRMVMIASLAFLGTAPAAAQSMNAEQFHARATALQKKGPLALFSGDVKLLMTEAKAAGERSHQLRLAAVKAGQKPRYCPPAGKRSMRSDEFMNRLSAIPQSERARIDMTEAMIRILSGKFPCPTA